MNATEPAANTKKDEGAAAGAGGASTPAHAGKCEALVARLEADPARGLDAGEVERRLAEYGPNELPASEPPSALKRFFVQFANPIVLTLLVAAVIATINGASSKSDDSILVRFGDAIAIGLIVVLNAVLGFYQERRAEQALEALKKMQTPNARVRRGDRTYVIEARTLVPGDILELEAGDAIPADARLLQTINLATQEAALTGESLPTTKDARAVLPEDAPIGDRSTMLFTGTSVVRGKGRAVVVATGAQTEIGKLSTMLAASGDTKTPLEERLDSFGTRVLWACLAISVFMFAWGMFRRQATWHELLLEAVSLAVAAIPEGLPAITTITLALGMQRMAKRGAIIRKLAAVETLGAATVICSDKTGTLTANEMTVREVFAGSRGFLVSGTGYDPAGEIKLDGSVVDASSLPALAHLLKTVVLANTAELEKKEGGWRVTGDPTEAALLTLAAKGGLPRESIVPSHQLLQEFPFDSDRKRMTVVTLDANGREVAHTKGSADVLVPRCDHVLDHEGQIGALGEDGREAILAEAERMSMQSLRVLAVARRELTDWGDARPSAETRHEEDHVEHGLTFVGLVGMIDPPRIGVKEAVAACKEAHVRAVMITGDHKLTAVAIAKELGLWDEGVLALTGSELEKLSDEELTAKVEDTRVFARVTAEQKLRIVRAFKQRGHVVAMTGDGVNDAPALREAHIGIAMGKMGTDVAREAADMVLADDNFATIVHAVREGRAIWRNIQKFIFFLLSSNAGLIVTVFVASVLPGLPALRPLMILWINLVTNGLPALALGIDPPDPNQMAERPREATSGLLGKREYLGIAVVGVLMGSAALACYYIAWSGAPTAGSMEDRFAYGRAAAFSLLALSPLFHALNCRSATASLFSARPLLPAALALSMIVSAAIHLVAVLVPTLRAVFQTYAMPVTDWLLLVGLSAAIVPAIELLKALQRLGLGGDQLGPISRRT